MSESPILKYVDGTPDDCSRAAYEIARDQSRESLPVRVFKQGPRDMVSGVMPVRVLLRILSHNSAAKGTTASKAIKSSNRPVDAKHVTGIAEYLLDAIKENKPYILPPLTLNATSGLEIYVPKGATGPITGWAVLPDDQRIFITDGQHRFLALLKVRDELHGTEEGNSFLNNGVPVMVTLSEDMEQVHQDFADAAKSKALPPSLVAVYDIRHPGNKAVLRLIDKVRLFQDRIDATSSTLSLNSPYVFLANQVRQFVKSSLTHNPSIKDDAFYSQATSLINPAAFEHWIESRITFLEVLTEMIPDWKEIASLPKPQGPEGHVVFSKMKEIRARQPVCLSAAALNALGLVSYEVLATMVDKGGKAPDPESLRQRLAALAEIDWSRSADMWQGNLVQDGVIKTQTTHVRSAAKRLVTFLTGYAQVAAGKN